MRRGGVDRRAGLPALRRAVRAPQGARGHPAARHRGPAARRQAAAAGAAGAAALLGHLRALAAPPAGGAAQEEPCRREQRGGGVRAGAHAAARQPVGVHRAVDAVRALRRRLAGGARHAAQRDPAALVALFPEPAAGDLGAQPGLRPPAVGGAVALPARRTGPAAPLRLRLRRRAGAGGAPDRRAGVPVHRRLHRLGALRPGADPARRAAAAAAAPGPALHRVPLRARLLPADRRLPARGAVRGAGGPGGTGRRRLPRRAGGALQARGGHGRCRGDGGGGAPGPVLLPLRPAGGERGADPGGGHRRHHRHRALRRHLAPRHAAAAARRAAAPRPRSPPTRCRRRCG